MAIRTTIRKPYTGTSPTLGRVIKKDASTPPNYDRADAATMPASMVGFGYSNPASDGGVRCVDLGETWAVELDPAAADVLIADASLAVVSGGYVKQSATAGDKAIGYSTDPPLGVPPSSQSITFTSAGKKYVWCRCAPHTIA